MFKHLRSQAGLDIASFHIECFLFVLPDALFAGVAADYLPALLDHIVSVDASTWWQQNYTTPCGDRIFFHPDECGLESWVSFHQAVTSWSGKAWLASNQNDLLLSRALWQQLLGVGFFPINVT